MPSPRLLWKWKMIRRLAFIATAAMFTQNANAQFAAFNNHGVTFGHMHVVVADLDFHKRLWPELFGAELVEREGFSAVRISNALIFFRHSEPTAPSTKTALDHFGLTVRDVNDVVAKWRALGYEVDAKSNGNDDASSVFITLPDGIRLALLEDPSQAEATSMAFVHVVTPARDELMAWYTEVFGADGATRENASSVLTMPGAYLKFEEANTARLPTDGAAIDHIGFEIENWDAFIESLQSAGTQFEFGPAYIESLDLWVAFFNDPSGVLVEVTHGLEHF